MMHSRVVIDSSVFVAFYSEVDANHADAVRLFSDFSDTIFIVHPYVIQETATVLCYKYGHKAVLPFLEHIREAGNIIIPPVSSIDDMKSFADLQKKVSFTDSTLIRLAKQSGAELVTFDKKMMSLARRS